MATIDNINTKLTNLQTYKTDITAAITEKGVTVPSGTKYAGFAPLIDQIQVASNGSKWTQSNYEERVLHVYYKNGAWYALPCWDTVVMKSVDGKSWTWPGISNTNTTYLGAIQGRTPIWSKHEYYEDDDGLLGSNEEVRGITPTTTLIASSSAASAWNTAITGSTEDKEPCFCSNITIETGGGLTIVRPAGMISNMSADGIGSMLNNVWRSCRSDFPYAYDALNGRMYYTDENCIKLYQVTGGTDNFSAYPECGLHTDGYYYIRRSIEYSNGSIIVRAVRDSVMGIYGLQYSTNGTTWNNSNVINQQGNSGYAFRCVYYANGRWVAGGPSTVGIYYSDDGKNWTKAEGIDSQVFDLYYYNGIWVAATGSGLYYSV